MSEKQRNPKLEIETNVPVLVTIGKMFYKGKNDYGDYFGYNLTANGSEYTFFASSFVHERFQAFGQGTTVKVVRRQRAGEKNVTWEIGEVNGSAPAHPPQKPDLKYEPSTFNRDAYREQRVERMRQAYMDAVKVRDLVGDDLSGEDLRSIAISFVIEENRDRVPLIPVEKPADANIPALLESIKSTISGYITGATEEDKKAKSDLLERAFGVGTWQPVTQMTGEVLIEGLAKLRAIITEEMEDIPF